MIINRSVEFRKKKFKKLRPMVSGFFLELVSGIKGIISHKLALRADII
jgi:hypothetical protein